MVRWSGTHINRKPPRRAYQSNFHRCQRGRVDGAGWEGRGEKGERREREMREGREGREGKGEGRKGRERERGVAAIHRNANWSAAKAIGAQPRR